MTETEFQANTSYTLFYYKKYIYINKQLFKRLIPASSLGNKKKRRMEHEDKEGRPQVNGRGLEGRRRNTRYTLLYYKYTRISVHKQLSSRLIPAFQSKHKQTENFPHFQFPQNPHASPQTRLTRKNYTLASVIGVVIIN